MKSCCDFFFKKSKLKKTNEIDNLNVSSSKLEINKTPTLKINSNQYHKDNDNSENLERITPSSTLNKKYSKNNYISCQDKSLYSSNNISRSRSPNAKLSKINTDKNFISLKYNKNSCCKSLTDKILCCFCGGKDCKVENYLKNPNQPNAIEGLNSNFITENIIAGQRLSDDLIKKYNLIEKFKQLNISIIVNLQREGEHPCCGPGKLNDFGFSYNPSYFSGDDINVKFFGWKENKSSLSINFILEIVKFMCEKIIENKQVIYIHSHSGNGRTAVIIACFLLYTSNKSVNDVINDITLKRKESFKDKRNIKYIKDFKNFLDDSRIIYGKKEKIEVYLKRQDDLLFGDEHSNFGYIPKIITRILEEIIRIKISYKIENIAVIKLLKGIYLDWNNELENLLFLLKKYLNKNDWSLFNANENLILFIELLYDFFEDSTFFTICPEKIDQLISDDFFNQFFTKNNYIQTKQQKIHILSLIKKIYYGYEFATLYQIAYFCANLYEKSTNETYKIEFEEMLERFSMELQGYNLTLINNIKNNEEYNKIELRVKSLSKIINFLILDILEPKTFLQSNQSNNFSNFLPAKSISKFLSTCIKKNRSSIKISNFGSISPSIQNGKNSSYFFTRDESDFPISDNDFFSPDDEVNLYNNKTEKRVFGNKKSKCISKKTLNKLLDNRIITKEQSTLLSFKNINQQILSTKQLALIKFINNENNSSHLQFKNVKNQNNVNCKSVLEEDDE